MKWKQDGGIFAGGQVGGDYQVSEAWSLRFRAEDDPRVVLDVHFFGEAETEFAAEHHLGPYHITRMVEPIICEDAAQPPGDTEVWSDGRYEIIQRHIVISDVPVKQLDEAARGYAALFTPDMIDWDGTPEGWKR